MSLILTILIGVFGGIVSGLFGVGGGLIFVPLLVIACHFDPHLAVGTSLAAIIPTAFVGLLKHQGAHLVDWKAALLIAVCAMVGAWIGAGLSMSLEASLLKRLLAVFLLFLSIKLFFFN